MLSFESAAKEYLNELIYNSSNGVVLTGPFKGMKLLRDIAWEDGNLGTKVLGCYEQELHGFIEEEIIRLDKLDDPPIILDLGCSEGYYAVGMALRLPRANILAIDRSERALEITALAAEANCVGVKTGKELFDELFNTGYSPNFVICDCEGGEMEYLDPDKFPGLKKATMLVECHDTKNIPVTKTLITRFEKTHEIFGCTEGGRNPNSFDILRGFNSLLRWLAVSEGRPVTMHWLMFRPQEVTI